MSSDSRDEELQDNDPTDELPILVETAVLDPAFVREAMRSGDLQGVDDATGEHTVHYPLLAAEHQAHEALDSLQRDFAARGTQIDALQADLQRMATRWLELERQLGERDVSIGRLEAALAAARASLDASASGERQRTADLAERDERLRHLGEELQRERLDRAAQDRELTEQRERQARLATDLDTVRAQLAAELAQPRSRLAEERVQALQEELDALRGYIAGRRARWDDLEAQLATATTRIAELEHELAHRADRQRSAEQVARDEGLRAESLRNDLVAAAHALQDRDRQFAAARAAELDPQRQIQQLQAELERTTALNRELQAALEARPPLPQTAAPSVAAPDEAALEIVAQLETELEHKRTQIVTLTAQAHSRAREAEDALADLANTRSALAEVNAELQQRRADIDRLERTVLERDRSLDARNERLAGLQREVDQKLATLQKLGTIDVAPHERDAPGPARTPQPDAGSETPALVCLTSDAPRQYALSKSTTTIGRSSHCDIQVFTQFVSREHARVVVDRSHVIIEDLGSTNGVFVNSVRIDRQELRHGDLLTVGETQFRFLERMAH
jgi:hypothetical protein